MRILSELYYGNISGVDHKPSKEYKAICDKELDLCTKLQQNLKDENLQDFEKLMDLIEDAKAQIEQEYYILGFKTALRITTECFDE